MTDPARYETLLAEWRAKEEEAATLREFRDSGGVHHLRVAIIRSEAEQTRVATAVINDMMPGAGWQKIVDAAVHRAEIAASNARARFESLAHASVNGRAPQ